MGLIPGLGRSPGEGNDYPFQYSGLENSTDRGAWKATVNGVTESDTTELRHTHTCIHIIVTGLKVLILSAKCECILIFHWLL